MEVIRNLDRFSSSEPVVVTIGNFDGLHLGHGRVLNAVKKRAAAVGGKSAIISFVPHTQAALASVSDFRVLTTPEEKIVLAERLGIDLLFLMNFTTGLREMEPTEFLKTVVLRKIKPAEVVLGYDHRFGRGRQGDFLLLKKICAAEGVKAVRVTQFSRNDRAVSSTLIRELVMLGKMEAVTELSGHPYLICGKVRHGHRIGRTLGFPTANLELPPEKLLMPDGVYKGFATVRGKRVRAVISLGERPTFKGKERILEAYLIDFSGNLYGGKLCLNIEGFIRKQQKFKNAENLKKKITTDIKESLKNSKGGTL